MLFLLLLFFCTASGASRILLPGGKHVPQNAAARQSADEGEPLAIARKRVFCAKKQKNPKKSRAAAAV
ncbi:Uncharacterised protein [Bordetella ansorpii]|uniref:Uncharacterized protein n=1 Tax=Bordetella ansorpii TaxID=288768 RepID=A0A157SK61_9BORD|nr:hypothetical protein [Bordetella ansorpii]SAI70850.1 Uncharacterised protein [Bordetella ansorpii]